MFGLSKWAGVLGALGTFVPALVAAQNTTTPEASTLYISRTQTQFSLNVANDSSDIYIYFASPAYSWVGVGFGSQMENSLMFIMYQNGNGDNVTISPRFGGKHSEPTFASSINIEALPGTTITDNEFVLKAVCRNCRVWPGGFLDVTSTAQPMTYAFGDGNDVQSNSLSADLKRHVRYGHFTMDMRAASGAGGVPAASNAPNGVSMSEMVRDSDPARIAHAIIGCIALFVVWPLNIMIAGFFKNIRIHIGLSVVILALLIVAYSLGISTSGQYNRSKSYTSPHQILAFLSLLPILLMSILPLPSLSSLHAKLPSLHMPLISLTFVLLVIAAGLGLHLASQARPIILAYSAVSLLVFVFNISISACIRRRGSAFRRQNRITEEEDQVPMRKWSGQSENEARFGLGLGQQQQTPAYHNHAEFGADGQRRFGAGTMPGPQYMLNYHPGVPVQIGRM